MICDRTVMGHYSPLRFTNISVPHKWGRDACPPCYVIHRVDPRHSLFVILRPSPRRCPPLRPLCRLETSGAEMTSKLASCFHLVLKKVKVGGNSFLGRRLVRMCIASIWESPWLSACIPNNMVWTGCTSYSFNQSYARKTSFFASFLIEIKLAAIDIWIAMFKKLASYYLVRVIVRNIYMHRKFIGTAEGTTKLLEQMKRHYVLYKSRNC
jgi:hypothetical protein